MTDMAKNDVTFCTSEDATRWRDVLTRITPTRADNIDEITGRYDPIRASVPGRIVFPEFTKIPVCRQSLEARPSIGVLVDDPDVDRTSLAARLASLAIERDCEIVVLSDHPICGLERFGFRTERLAGETDEARAVCVEQLQRFWGIEIFI